MSSHTSGAAAATLAVGKEKDRAALLLVTAESALMMVGEVAASLLPTTIATVLMLDVGEAAAMTVAREMAASLPLATVTTVLALYEEEAATLTAVGGVAASLPLTTVAIALPLEGGVGREREEEGALLLGSTVDAEGASPAAAHDVCQKMPWLFDGASHATTTCEPRFVQVVHTVSRQ